MGVIFKPVEELKSNELSQGDLLERTDALVVALGRAHAYYANSVDYTHFVVITQSCDLVRRRGEFNAPYITIAAAKPMKGAVSSFVGSVSKPVANADFSYITKTGLEKSKMLVERYANNTEVESFFLPKSENQNLTEDLLVYLRLSIALRKEHYDVLANAKIGELVDIFAAKLGWLKGNIYSRVATPDLDEIGLSGAAVKDALYDEYINALGLIQLSSLQADRLRALVEARAREIGRPLVRDEVLDILDSSVPTDLEILSEEIVNRMAKNGAIDRADADKMARARSSIMNSSIAKSLAAKA